MLPSNLAWEPKAKNAPVSRSLSVAGKIFFGNTTVMGPANGATPAAAKSQVRSSSCAPFTADMRLGRFSQIPNTSKKHSQHIIDRDLF